MPLGKDDLTEFLRGRVAERLDGRPVPDGDADLFDCGLDSIDAVEISGELEQALEAEVDPVLMFEFPTINSAVDRLLGRLCCS